MTSISLGSVLRSVRPVVVLVGMAVTPFLAATPVFAQSGDRVFSGIYVGVDAGRQHVIGGALIDGVDTLQEDSRNVASLFGGLRMQFGGVVVGGEVGAGITDGDLVLNQPSKRLKVDYRNGGQRHWALTAGHTAGRNTLVYGYLSEVSREFDVTIDIDGRTVEQSDEQGLLRFGIGVERRLVGPMHVRFAVGTSRADFGDRATNIKIERRLDASFGVVFQF